MRTHVVSLWNHTQHLSWLSHHKHRFLTSDLHGSQICGIEWGLQWYHCNTKQRMTMRWFKETVLWKHLQTRTTPDLNVIENIGCTWRWKWHYSDHLFDVIQNVWQQIYLYYIQSLYQSIPHFRQKMTSDKELRYVLVSKRELNTQINAVILFLDKYNWHVNAFHFFCWLLKV